MPYATAILARFDRLPARMTFVNAGHPPGFLVRDGEPIALGSTGVPLGLWPDTSYQVTEALEGAPLSLRDVLRQAARSGLKEPSDLCAHLLRLAGMAPGPPGVVGWEDDRTSLSFRVLHPRSPS